jgi:hypothetical protein
LNLGANWLAGFERDGFMLGAHSHATWGIMRADILKTGLPRTFSSAEGTVIRRRILQGDIGRVVVNVKPCGLARE